MAQLVEQRIRNAQVMGSSPIGSSTEKPPLNVEFSMLGGGFLFVYLVTFIYILAIKKGCLGGYGVVPPVVPSEEAYAFPFIFSAAWMIVVVSA